jgi:hypothetical protein
MSRATNRIAALIVAIMLAPSLITAAVALPAGSVPHPATNPPLKMSPTNLTKQECTQLGGTVSTEATSVCRSGKGCTTTSSCGKGCVQENFACLSE